MVMKGLTLEIILCQVKFTPLAHTNYNNNSITFSMSFNISKQGGIGGTFKLLAAALLGILLSFKAEWHLFQSWAMLNSPALTIQTPTWFITFSSADTFWPELFQQVHHNFKN